MSGTKTMIHLIIAPNELPFDYEEKVCAAVDIYENKERTTASYRLNYEELTPTEQQLWDDFVTMINAKEIS